MKQLCYLIFLILINPFISSQTDSSLKHPILKLKGFALRIGAGIKEAGDLNQSDYQKVAPNNSLINSNLNGLKKESYQRFGMTDIDAILFFKPEGRNQYNERIEYRLILSYQGTRSNDLIYSRIDSIPVDTFRSQTTGVVFTTDSLNITAYLFKHHTENVALEISCLFNVLKKRVFKLYAGISAGAGYTANSEIIAKYNQSEHNPYRFYEYGKRHFEYEKEEKTMLNNTMLFQFNIPIGIHLKFHPRSPISLNSEIRFGDRVEKLPNLNYHHLPYLLVNVGLKYTFKK